MAGRPLTLDGEVEERSVQAQSMRALLDEHDRFESVALRSAYRHVLNILDRNGDGSLDYRDAMVAARALRELIVADRRENRIHAEVSPEVVLLTEAV